VSRLLGEGDRSAVVWDYVALYQPRAVWDQAPPAATFSKKPVIRGIGGTKDAVERLLQFAVAIGRPIVQGLVK